MIITGKPNLIYLENAVDIDELLDSDNFFDHCSEVERQIAHELGIKNLENRFNKYAWYGREANLPWSFKHGEENQFNPLEISVIVPISEEFFWIRGQNRRIILTKPALYTGKKPNFVVGLVDNSQAQGIRVLEGSVTNPFFGLGQALTEEGYRSLPQIGKEQDRTLFLLDEKGLLVPETSADYF